MATPFDAKAYEQAVVKPLRGWSGRELPDDLVARYAIDLAMSDQEVERRLREVRSRWNKGLSSAGFAQKVYRAFLKADERLQQEHGAKFSAIAWWQAYAAARQGANQERVDDLAATLRKHFGELGLIAPGQLDATVRAAYSSLSPDEVEEAVAKAGVRRSTPVELPKASGLLDTTYRHLRDHLIDAAKSSVVELLHDDAASFRLLDRPVDLSAAVVNRAVERENKRAGNQGARQALGILATAAKDGDLRKLALFHLVDEIRKQHGHGAPPSVLLKQLRQTRWDPDEARLALFSVLNESGRAPSGNLGSIRDLLEQGMLRAAQQMLSSIAGAEDSAAATALVDRQQAKVQELVAGAREALREGAEADAANRFRQAVALAGDDEELRAELRRIPPEPVLGVVAREDGVTLRLSWRPAASHGEGTRYRLVRKEGRVPADPDDGVVIMVEAGKSVAVDRKVPAGTPVGYAVFASAEGSPWSRPAGVTAEVLPGVGDVRLSFSDGAIEGRWIVHPEAVGVDVVRGDGVTITTGGRTQFRDRTAPEGNEQVYTLIARYRRGDGTEAASAPVRVRTAVGGRPLPVRALTLQAAKGGTGPRVKLAWKAQADTEVVIRRAATPCRWQFGEVVTPADVGDYGEEVLGTRDENDGWQTLVADVPTGRFHYVAFTVGPNGAIRGHDEALGLALPVSGLQCRRLGDAVLLAWEWPEQVGTAEVRWQAGQESGKQLLTRQQYQTGGGCRIPCGQVEVRVKVRTKVLAEGGECTSADVELTVPARPPTVRYTVDMTRKPLVGGGTVKVLLRADQAIPRCTVIVVAAEGPVMPRRPADGRELIRGERALSPDHDVDLITALPRLRKPYWVRCFVDTAGVHIVDPPVKQLKVS
ncbi:hypothetical protein [Amycolatopsis alba]|uniref:SaeA first Fn3-like domain-containing protein n=1 Tax=Amycolatopsis alba DSM 44262 TaxID=1125972 RepID=A0A229RKN1_AMYAL|nr:hypothetical protein [Amycolatopsis alba]OXM47039.1 hypothetical protein CFP75_25525 [Amycolatopsis alba DSM 44262]